MRNVGSLFLFWVALLSLFVSITGVLSKLDFSARISQILFIPVTVYLLLSLITHLSNGTPVLYRESGWKRLLIYYCFVVTSTLVTVGFLSSHTLSQVISSAIFSPLAVYFLILVWPRSSSTIDPSKISKSGDTQRDFKDMFVPSTNIDVNRRDFLKLIGTAGILAFTFNLFTKRSVPFFANVTDIGTASLKDSSGNKIDPAEKSPTDGYHISEVDDSSTAYFGFVNIHGQWYIMRQDTDDTFRYVKGDNDFAGNWAKRDSFTYNYFDNVF